MDEAEVDDEDEVEEQDRDDHAMDDHGGAQLEVDEPLMSWRFNSLHAPR